MGASPNRIRGPCRTEYAGRVETEELGRRGLRSHVAGSRITVVLWRSTFGHQSAAGGSGLHSRAGSPCGGDLDWVDAGLHWIGHVGGCL